MYYGRSLLRTRVGALCCLVYVCVRVWFFHSIFQDKSQIEFLTENKRKLQHQLEEECDYLRKDKIKLTGEL